MKSSSLNSNHRDKIVEDLSEREILKKLLVVGPIFLLLTVIWGFLSVRLVTFIFP